MNDIVFIQGLKIDAIIGVYDWERAIGQLLVVDCEMVCDTTKASQTDDVAHAINYKSVCEDIERLCCDIKAKLLEKLAQEICAYLLENYPCQTITLSIHKPNAIQHADSVGVKIVRHQST